MRDILMTYLVVIFSPYEKKIKILKNNFYGSSLIEISFNFD
jgi:hypothetical protein